MNASGREISAQKRRLRALLAWLTRSGVDTGAVALASRGPSDRCIVAGRRIEAQEEVMRIPLRCIMTPQVAIDSPIGRTVSAAPVEVRGDDAWLAMLILAEGRRSPWRAYIAALPPAVPEHPLFFGAREMKLLKGSMLGRVILRMRRVIRDEHALLRRHVAGFRHVSLPRYQWARLMVASRAFRLRMNGRGRDCMVPLADMLNHHTDPDTKFALDEERGEFVVRAQRPLQACDEIHDNYGDKSNVLLMRLYGFAIEHNPHDIAMVVARLPRRYAIASWRRCFPAHRAPPAQRTFQLTSNPQPDGERDLLRYLRLTRENPRTLLQRGSQPGEFIDGTHPLGVANEIAAQREIVRACRAALREFETTCDEDETLLQDKSMPLTHRRCILTRLGEKRVLHQHLQRASGILAALTAAR